MNANNGDSVCTVRHGVGKKKKGGGWGGGGGGDRRRCLRDGRTVTEGGV